MKISYTILSGFLLILLLFSITTYMNYRQSQLVNESTEKFARSSSTLRQSYRFQRNVLNMVSGLRGFLLTNESSFLESYDSAMLENDVILNELSMDIPYDTAQTKLAREIEQLNNRWINEFATPLIEAKKHSTLSDSSAASFTKLYRKKLSEGIEKDIQRILQRDFKIFTNNEYTERERQRVALTQAVDRTGRISFGLTSLSVILGIGIAVFLATYISSVVVKLVRMANAIAEGNYTVSMRGTGNNEIGQLARALNNMARVLKENISLLEQKNNELNQFAHIVSHDIKAPLRGIDNVVNWIEEDHSIELPPKVKEYVQLIKGRTMRAENMLNGLLSYSRVGREVQQKEEVQLGEMLEEIKGNLAEKKGLTLHIEPNLPELYTERLPLFQVFSNLITNAHKHHDKETGEVKVYHKMYDDHYEFFVEDNGPGISRSYHEKIFMIFQTLKERDSFESTGVGLAIVKKILTDRKLSIKIISEPGKGAIFAFTWPKNEHNE